MNKMTWFHLLCLVMAGMAQTEDSTESNESFVKGTSVKESIAKENNFDASNEDWGSYYDPQNIFCGNFDCYKILGFDYESFGKEHPTTKEITKRYRQLSREWHPDKSKHKDAKNRFVKIARAYEVLTSIVQRKEYDELRYNQQAYFDKYGASVLWSYAPKTDTAFVVLIIFVVANVFSWFAQKHRWQLIADRLIKAAVEDWTPSQGGSPESKQLREKALDLLHTKENEDYKEPDALTSKVSTPKKSKMKGVKKIAGKERKQQEQEAVVPIITALVNDMNDFGGGFHKPTWKDLLIVSLARMPYKVAHGILWQTKYYIRRLQKHELNEDEQLVLTRRAVGPVYWETATDEDREDMVKKELWILENLVEWNEEQEIKKLSAAEQKYYNKLKKKGKLDKLE
jgi:DnaJ family protein C protein 25